MDYVDKQGHSSFAFQGIYRSLLNDKYKTVSNPKQNILP